MMPNRSARWHYITLGVHLGLLALAAIYWGICAGANAPFIYHPDEPDLIGRAIQMMVSGDLNPHWFHWPTLLMYVYATIFKFIRLFIDIPFELGVYARLQGANPEVFFAYYIARLVTVCFSLGTLYLLLRFTSRVSSPLMASLAGITFIGSEIVRDSAFSATVDMPMTFFVLASLVLTERFVDSAQRGQPKERYLWCAVVFGGMAAGTKYNGAVILLTIPFALWLANMPLRWSLRRLPLMALLSIAVFVFTTPFSILDAKTFVDLRTGMPFNFVHYSSGHPGADEAVGLLKAIKDLFNRHSVLVCVALLCPLAIRKTAIRKPLALISLAAILFLATVSVARTYFPRNLLPLLPALDCLIAVTIWGIAGKLLHDPARKQIILRTVLPVVVVFAVSSLDSLHTLHTTWREIKRTDNRTLAYTWITENIPKGTSILQEAYCPQLYFANKFKVTYLWTASQISFEDVVREFDYVVVSEKQWERFDNWGNRTYEPLFKLPLFREWTHIPGESIGPAIRIYATGRETEL